MKQILNVTDKNINEILLNNKKVIVKFGAIWCGECKRLKPTFDKLSEEIKDCTFCECDIEDADDMIQEFGIMSLPTIIVFEDGVKVEKFSGLISESALKELLK